MLLVFTILHTVCVITFTHVNFGLFVSNKDVDFPRFINLFCFVRILLIICENFCHYAKFISFFMGKFKVHLLFIYIIMSWIAITRLHFIVTVYCNTFIYTFIRKIHIWYIYIVIIVIYFYLSLFAETVSKNKPYNLMENKYNLFIIMIITNYNIILYYSW